MALLPPPYVGFVHNPNLVLPDYILFEVVQIMDQNGIIQLLRRPRPPSITACAQLVLQCDRHRLQRYEFYSRETKDRKWISFMFRISDFSVSPEPPPFP